MRANHSRSAGTGVWSGLFLTAIAGGAVIFCSPVAAVLVAVPSVIMANVCFYSALNQCKRNSIELDKRLQEQFTDEQIDEIYQESGGTLNDVIRTADLAAAGNILAISSFCFAGAGAGANAVLPESEQDTSMINVHRFDVGLGFDLTVPRLGAGGAITLAAGAGVSLMLFSLDGLRTVNNHQRRVNEAASKLQPKIAANATAPKNMAVATHLSSAQHSATQHSRHKRRHKRK